MEPRSAVVLLGACAELATTPGGARHAAFSKLAADVVAANYSLYVVADDSSCPGVCAMLAAAAYWPGVEEQCVQRSTVGSARFFEPFDGYPLSSAHADSRTPWWYQTFWAWEHGLHLTLAQRPELRAAPFVWLLESDVAYSGDWGAFLRRYDRA